MSPDVSATRVTVTSRRAAEMMMRQKPTDASITRAAVGGDAIFIVAGLSYQLL
jgi:hypothetical protein